MKSRRKWAERKSADDITIARYAKESFGMAPELRASMPALNSNRIFRHDHATSSGMVKNAVSTKKLNWTAIKNFLAPSNGLKTWKILATKRRPRAVKKSTENLTKCGLR